jgi:hypothetical protein
LSIVLAYPWICLKRMLLFNGMVAATIRFSYIPPPWVCVVVKDIGIAKWKVVVITVCLMYFTLSLARYVSVIQQIDSSQ